ncbi:MAG TPA: protein-disulfide reductase DsbD [Steroidobacteraceae bacterium]|nr:protein-disulfide reductase DsbD [Steroidobacteraceae bacterium]
MTFKAFTRISRPLAAILVLCGLAGAQARAADGASLLTGLAAPADDFLPVEQAFKFNARAEGPDKILLNWTIAPGYYLYRDRIKVVAAADGATVGKPEMPDGITKIDEFFGKQVIYHDALMAKAAVARASSAALTVPIKVTYQGCAEKGLCYPPVTKTVDIQLPAGSGGAGGYVSRQDLLTSTLLNRGIFAVLGIFFASGLLLAFTPCVLPMVPILSRLIAGQGGKITTRRAFSLSLTYVLGMSLTYTVAGAAAAAAGKQVQAMFQQPWIIALFAALFVAMALSMFGLYTVQMPAAIQTRLSGTSNRQRAGTFGGVAVMGALSALIVTTCVAPALVAALVVIGQTGNVARGAAALFAMSMGMGAPLLVIGTSAGALLPKAGPWMDGVKQIFGVLMLAMAVWMLSRIIPGWATLAGLAIPAFLGMWVLWRLARTGRGRWISRTLATAAGLYGVALVGGAALGHSDPLAPVSFTSAKPAQALDFRAISSVAQLQSAVKQASAAGRPVLLDFYADWCVSCKEMEKYTFTDPSVKQTLGNAVLLRADVTANGADDQALLQLFHIFGPPTIAFYDPKGNERSQFRVVGYMKAAEFASVARQALAGTS